MNILIFYEIEPWLIFCIYPIMHRVWRPVKGYLSRNAVSCQCLNWKYFTFATNSWAETCAKLKSIFILWNWLWEWLATCLIKEIFWLMTPCQECQEKVEFSIVEEAVGACFWWSYFSINCTWVNNPGNPSLKRTQRSCKARELQAIDNQWAVATGIAN